MKVTPASAFGGRDGCSSERRDARAPSSPPPRELPRRLRADTSVDGAKLCRALERRSQALSPHASCRLDESLPVCCRRRRRRRSLARSETKEQSFVRLSVNFNWFSKITAANRVSLVWSGAVRRLINRFFFFFSPHLRRIKQTAVITVLVKIGVCCCHVSSHHPLIAAR